MGILATQRSNLPTTKKTAPTLFNYIHKATTQYRFIFYIFFFGRPRPFLGTGSESISIKKVLTGEAFKARVGFEAEIGIVARAQVGKFSTASRGANSNIEGLDINNSAAGLIALITELAKYVGLIVLVFTLKRPGRILVVTNFFSYLSISF